MFIQTHAKLAMDLYPVLDKNSTDQLIVGSILPDAAEIGIGDEYETHYNTVDFLKYLPTEFKYLGIGFLTHGEDPRCLDYYTHQGFYKHKKYKVPDTKSKGYIAKKYIEVGNILKQHKRSLGKLDIRDALHFVTEFCVEHVVARSNKQLARRVDCAMKNPMMRKAAMHYANHFSINKRELRRLIRIFNSAHVKTFLTNFQSVKGTAHNFQNFVYFKLIREKKKGNLVKKLSLVARSSLGFLQTKLLDRSLVLLFERCITAIEPDANKFLKSTELQIKRVLSQKGL